jgi:NAD-dependent dihydropyrimidine dehydrogenase PreA subunit
MKEAALCGLGKSAPNPVLSTIKYFRNEYEAHIKDKTCPAGICPSLTRYVIDEKACKSCGACSKACPVSAISGEKSKPGKQGLPYKIDGKICISCGSCRSACRFNAVYTEGRKA